MIVKALHPSIDGNPRTYLTVKAASGQADLTVQNVAGLSANDMLVIGNPAEELTEIKKISSITGKVITLSANLVNTHPENTKITFIKYDQVKFYKATSIAGSYSLVSTKDLAIGEPHTLYDDATALSTDYFKIRYYNTQSTELSVLSDAIGSGGFSRYALISLQDALIAKFGDKKNQFLVRSEITDWINEIKDDMVNEIAESNEKHFAEYAELTTDANGLVACPSDFKKEQRLNVDYSGTPRRARKVEIEDVDDTYTYHQENPFWFFNNYNIEIRPKGIATLDLYYEAHPADLANDSDELPKPIRFYVHVLMDGLMSKALEKDKKFADSDRYYTKYQLGKENMIEHINNIALDENRGVRDEELEDY